ncbi:DUF2235 domain-containing protein [Rhodoferax lacus]|uniref:DUF2235 domain-containing protein n=1 Tax=Rhodoferax lacus TaxID=2184758 RepID=A0A3E1RA57_9BURK|nr:DUF2235 domain-containing protein [Rhodoferax lacus]RFO96248.1 DUF2235 domain-containing protein [Rhodoferax lacus]
MSTQSPSPFPKEGARKLTDRERLEQTNASACTLPSRPGPQCESQLYVGLFFDGTGNNMQMDYEELPPDRRKHTNVVKLYQAFPDVTKDGYFRSYIPGVGTPFPEIGDSNTYLFNANRGAIGGEMGEHRILWALLQLFNAPMRYLRGEKFPLVTDAEAKDKCSVLSTSLAAQRRLVLKTYQGKLKEAMKAYKPKITQINLSVFGFSRGAAEARVFVNWLMEVCEQKDGGWLFADMALNVQFLGIFDTVASVGLANINDSGVLAGHQGWADNTLEIHPAVRKCVHFVAGHELRACFPLDSVRVKNSYPANAKEVMYPGSHSDVGGGYAPKDLGVWPTAGEALSILPGKSMYDEAVQAGVPLVAWDKLDKQIKDSLTPTTSTTTAFNNYLREAAVSGGPVEDMHREHMALYHSYRYAMRHRFLQAAPYAAAGAKDKAYLRKTQEDFLRTLGLGLVDVMQSHTPPAEIAQSHRKMLVATGVTASMAERRVHDVAAHIQPERVTPAVDTLFSRYVHDSLAGFIGFGMDEYAVNKMGMAKYRTVFKGDD